MQAQAVATQLMIELTGATVRPGTVDVGGDGPALKTISLRDAKLNNLLGTTIPRERSREILTALEFDDAGRAGGARGHRPRVPPRRRQPRGRPDRGGRAARRRREAAGDAALAPQRVRPADRSASACAGAPPTHSPPRVCTRSSAGASSRPSRRSGCGSPDVPALTLANPMSSDQSQLRTMLLGSLLDTARSNRSRGAATLRLFEAGAVYLASEGDQLPHEPYHVAALLHGPVRAPTWRDPEPRDARLLRRQGRARRHARRAHGRLDRPARPRSRSCTRAAPPKSSWRTTR